MKKPKKREIIDLILERSKSYSVDYLKGKSLNYCCYLINQLLMAEKKHLCPICWKEIATIGEVCIKCQFKNFKNEGREVF